MTEPTLLADFSFGHDTMTGQLLRQLGFAGGIGYTSPDPSKNLTHENLADLLANDLAVGLVYEDFNADWMLGGATKGHYAGSLARAQANMIGYDTSCTILAAADFNVTPAQLPIVMECYAAFGLYVRAGGYGNKLFLDAIAAADLQWQTDAHSWGVADNANVYQLYNDHRAQGYPIDVNTVHRLPVTIMNYPNPLPPKDDDMKGIIQAYDNAMWLIDPDCHGRVHITGGGTVDNVAALRATGNYVDGSLGADFVATIPIVTAVAVPTPAP